MAISTNSIIHYTTALDSLARILTEGFKVFYCYERILAKGDKMLNGSFPMVSFCDIPLSDVKAHLDAYGHYGIGLTKEWAKSKGLNPIIYFETNSNLLNYYRDEFERLNIKRKEKKIQMEDFEHLLMILSYAKNYQGKLDKTGQSDYRFYDEREWRYIPTKEEIGDAERWLPGKAYTKDKDKYNNKIAELKLSFKPSDISYIIVKDENDIKKITKILRTQFDSVCTVAELEIVMTRIRRIIVMKTKNNYQIIEICYIAQFMLSF